jgi:hypothetical protein
VEKIITIFVSWEALLVAFTSFIILQIIRRVGTNIDEGGNKKGPTQHRFFQMFLPLYPYLLTIGLIFIPGVPTPAALEKTIAVKILFGLWTGWISGFSYQIVKKVLEKGFNMNFDDPSASVIPPTPRAAPATPRTDNPSDIQK